MTVIARRVAWERTFRIIRAVHPLVDLFEGIADTADWEALASAEAKSNPSIWNSIGDLSKVPENRRVSGPGASRVMAPFLHCSPQRPNRFSDGTFGLYYAGDSTSAAIAETVHHHGETMRGTNERPGWTTEFRELIGSIDAVLDDVSDQADLLNPHDYTASQAFGAKRRLAGSKGITWPSVRITDAQCIAAFWPDVVSIPAEGERFAYHWNGSSVDYVKNLDTGVVMQVC